MYGRRRVGKSTLIREAIKDRPHIFYQATRVTSSLNLEAFKTEVARALGSDELLTGITDWLAVLHYLARAAEHHRGLIVVLDEFPYLTDADPALPSVVQKLWDSEATRTEYGRGNDRRYFVLYAKAGFTTALKRRAATQSGIALHTPQTMLRAQSTGTRSRKKRARPDA